MKKNPLFTGSLLVIAGSMAVNAVNYLYHLVMGRMLGPENYGILSSLFSLLYIVTIIPISSGFAIVKFVSQAPIDQKPSVYNGINRFIIRLGAVLTPLLLILSWPLATYLHLPNVFPIFMVPLVFFLSIITLVNQSTLQSLLNFWGLVGPNLVSSIAKFGLGVIAVALGWSVSGAMGAVVVSVFLAFLLSVYLLPTAYRHPSSSQFLLRPFLEYALPVLLQSLAFTSLFTVDILLVKHYFDPTVAGWYAALSLLGKIVYFAAQPVSAVMFPLVTQKISSGKKYLPIFWMSFTLTAMISLVVLGVYFLFPTLSINLLFGPEYLGIQPELIWMGLFMLLYNLDYFLVSFFLAINTIQIVFLPIMAAIAQVLAITLWHNNLHQVILASTIIMGALLAFLLSSLWSVKKN